MLRVLLAAVVLVAAIACATTSADETLDNRFSNAFHRFCLHNLDTIDTAAELPVSIDELAYVVNEIVGNRLGDKYVTQTAYGLEACDVWYDPSHSRWEDATVDGPTGPDF